MAFSDERRKYPRISPDTDETVDLEIRGFDGTVHLIKGIIVNESAGGLQLAIRHHAFLQPNLQTKSTRRNGKTKEGRTVWIQGCDTVVARMGVEYNEPEKK